ncbi:hypothetical protein [Stenotrophomonas maltophilia]|uniref:hypothetical protein n=1 Tax=Stenotrophomonas maltophilia TaxID=40324 RepID=UPI00209BA87C|nr:hypothetical protein [Stenotrophomonas maltophilia]MCO7486280.1 hypothetical protein [Stenotrophomonas maltophilia]
MDTSRPGLLGICGDGGYSLAAARAEKRFKAVATISMFNSGRLRQRLDENLGQRVWCWTKPTLCVSLMNSSRSTSVARRCHRPL